LKVLISYRFLYLASIEATLTAVIPESAPRHNSEVEWRLGKIRLRLGTPWTSTALAVKSELF
jgi:hypothetical protein